MASPAMAAGFNQPLVDAADKGDEPAVISLLRSGAPANVRGEFQVTPLMRAAFNGHAEVAEKLIMAGADVNAVDLGGATALHLASRQGHKAVTALLLKYQAQVDMADNEGWTPLMRAAANRRTEIVKLLLEKGANFAHPNHYGETPLMQAVRAGHLETVKLLLAKGADPRVKNNAGNSALTLAFKRGKEFQSMLEAYAAQPSPAADIVPAGPVEAAAAKNREMLIEVKPKASITAKAEPASEEKILPAVTEVKAVSTPWADPDAVEDAPPPLKEPMAKAIPAEPKLAFPAAKTPSLPVNIASALSPEDGEVTDKPDTVFSKGSDEFLRQPWQSLGVREEPETEELKPMEEEPTVRRGKLQVPKLEEKLEPATLEKKEEKIETKTRASSSPPWKVLKEVEPVKEEPAKTEIKSEPVVHQAALIDLRESMPWQTVEPKSQPVEEEPAKNQVLKDSILMEEAEKDAVAEAVPTPPAIVQAPPPPAVAPSPAPVAEAPIKEVPMAVIAVPEEKKPEQKKEAPRAKVEVGEAIRVPLSDEIPVAQRRPSGFLPSESGSLKGLWVEVSGLAHEAEAEDLSNAVLTRMTRPDLRLRVIRKGFLQSANTTLRAGAFVNQAEAQAFCDLPEVRSKSCALIKEMGARAASAPVATPAEAPTIFWMQLGTFSNETDALERWHSLKEIHNDVLAGASPNVSLPPRGSNGTPLYRLRAGPFYKPAQAQTRCEALAKRGISCIMIKNLL